MDKFTTLSGTAAPMTLDNIDTDMIIPKQFLKTIKRSGLGKVVFNDMRYDPCCSCSLISSNLRASLRLKLTFIS